MNNLFLTLLETALVLALYYFAYVFFLRNEKNFVLNRFYLLFALLFSVIYPFIRIKFTIETAAIPQLLQTNIAAMVLPEIIVSANNTGSSLNFSMFDILRNIYFAGIVIFAILFFVKIFNVLRMIIFAKKERQNDIFIIKTKQNYAPFSFFNFVVIPENQYDKSEEATIIFHEKKHIAQLHSLDLIFYEIIKILQWFNPFIWLYNRELRSIHEYIADEAVIANGTAQNDYFSLLMFNQIGCQTSKIGNNFNILLIKKRIFMLTNSKTKNVRMLRLIPAMLVTAALLMSQVSLAQKPKSVSQKVENQPVAENDTVSRQDILYIVDGKEVDMYFVNRIDPNDIEAVTVLKESTSVELYGEKGKNGVILITLKKPIDDEDIPKNAVYVVDGKVVADISNLKEDNIRVMDIYTGGGVRQEHIAQYGEKAKNGVVIITQKTAEDREKEWERYKKGTEDEIFPQPEVKPEFKGGQSELMEFLTQNVNYPKIAHENGVDGKIYIRFVVEKDGSVSNVEWLSTNLEKGKMRDAVKALEEEAMRVSKLTSGKWTAGQNNGKPVRCEFVLPITFVLK